MAFIGSESNVFKAGNEKSRVNVTKIFRSCFAAFLRARYHELLYTILKPVFYFLSVSKSFQMTLSISSGAKGNIGSCCPVFINYFEKLQIDFFFKNFFLSQRLV